VARHHYDAQSIFLSIQCAISGSAGFRCVERIFKIIGNFFTDLGQPVFSTIRDWVTRFGLYMLERPKPLDEWIYIIDASIQIGAMKLLLILGVQRSVLEQKDNYILSYDDMEPLVLKTVTSSTGEVVKEALLEAEEKTGTPSAVLSDGGADLKKGMRLFNEDNRKTLHILDVVHKLDLILKKELKDDEIWCALKKQMTDSVQKLKHTDFSHFTPPKQRAKNRMLGEIQVVKWGRRVLRYFDRGDVPEEIHEKLHWIKSYRVAITEYRQISIICQFAINKVRLHGYCQGISKMCEQKYGNMLLTDRSKQFAEKIISAVREEEDKVPPEMCFPGSSEIIESVFGKFKQLEKNHSSGGLTSLVLSVPALLGKPSIDLIPVAFEQTPVRRRRDWIKHNLGITFWSKRKRDLGDSKEDVPVKNYLDMDEISLDMI